MTVPSLPPLVSERIVRLCERLARRMAPPSHVLALTSQSSASVHDQVTETQEVMQYYLTHRPELVQLCAQVVRSATSARLKDARVLTDLIASLQSFTPDSEGDPSEYVAQMEILRAIAEEISSLPNDKTLPCAMLVRAILTDGLTLHEAASRIGLSMSKAAVVLAHAGLLLRNRLKARGITFEDLF